MTQVVGFSVKDQPPDGCGVHDVQGGSDCGLVQVTEMASTHKTTSQIMVGMKKNSSQVLNESVPWMMRTRTGFLTKKANPVL